jgi:hypothetical protein
VSYTKSGATISAQAEQPNQHGKKQDDVSDDKDDDVKSNALWIELYALQQSGVPVETEL